MYAKFVRYIEANVEDGLKGKQYLASANVKALVKISIHNAFARVMNEMLLEVKTPPDGAKPESEGAE